ncbi:F-box protein SNE-like [Ipomoea triloba]|uniref:F-box protein SNE-like n=1 Tax=Ipomoea triloba TaxID=35885 RepID=UPI00125D51A4|nr:F-box protein SNE-like [Ipomoea triloba]
MAEEREKRRSNNKFCINDNVDVLIEILKRLDGRSMGAAACVCRLWCAISRNDSLWEHLCFRHVSPPPEGVRTVVTALGGYRRLYMVCVRPVVSRLSSWRIGLAAAAESSDRVWTRNEVELSLSLFCVDYYERVLLGDNGGGGGGGRIGDDSSTASLMFLCKAVNV